MTRKQLTFQLWSITTVFVLAVVGGIVLRRIDFDGSLRIYDTYRELVPIVIAIPAAWLAFAFQRRNAYVQSLRSLWSNVVAAVQGAQSYTSVSAPTEDKYNAVLLSLRIVIDDMRGMFANVSGDGLTGGWYPFEPIKQIHDEMSSFGHRADATTSEREELRRRIENHWKPVRDQILKELDRSVPTHHHAGYSKRRN